MSWRWDLLNIGGCVSATKAQAAPQALRELWTRRARTERFCDKKLESILTEARHGEFLARLRFKEVDRVERVGISWK